MNKILGLELKDWVGLLHGESQKKTQKALNYLDGKQEDEVIKVLNDPNKGRKSWQEKGFIPRYRNLTSSVVEKSGQLFSGSLPLFEIYRKGQNTIDEVQTQNFYNVINSFTFHETLINDDLVRRLIKTTGWLIQVDNNQQLIIDILHRANSNIVKDLNGNIIGLIYTTGEDSYRIWTIEQIFDVQQDDKQFSITTVNENPYGIIPISFFYDTKLPRQGTWVESDNTIVSFNESYNLHLTDSEYSMKWAKLPTLFMIDCEIDTAGVESTTQEIVYGQALPITVPSSPEVGGGPGSIINVISNGVKTPSMKYEGPTPDIKAMDEVYKDWAVAIAQDWSVRLRTDGQGSANSGFQVIVEEIPNQELRKLRQRMFENSFKRAWEVIRVVLNTSSQFTFTDDSEMFVHFDEPRLPVDPLQQEELWTKRIESGRATVVDYFKQEMGLTEEEAVNRWKEILIFNQQQKTIKQPTDDNEVEV